MRIKAVIKVSVLAVLAGPARPLQVSCHICNKMEGHDKEKQAELVFIVLPLF